MKRVFTIEDFDDFKESFTNPLTIPMLCAVVNRFNHFWKTVKIVEGKPEDINLFIAYVMSIARHNKCCEPYMDNAVYELQMCMKPLWRKDAVKFESSAIEFGYLMGCAYPYASCEEPGVQFIKFYGKRFDNGDVSIDGNNVYSELVKIVCDVCTELTNNGSVQTYGNNRISINNSVK